MNDSKTTPSDPAPYDTENQGENWAFANERARVLALQYVCPVCGGECENSNDGAYM